MICAWPRLAQAVEDELEPPQWSFTAGVLGTPGLVSQGFGARGGLRLWLGHYALASLVVEYEHARLVGPSANLTTQIRSEEGHQLALELRVEVAQWSEFSKEWWGLPKASIYLYASPVVFVSPDPTMGNGFGYRAGVGVQFNALIAFFAPPVFIEVDWQHLSFASPVVEGFRLIFGIGV